MDDKIVKMKKNELVENENELNGEVSTVTENDENIEVTWDKLKDLFIDVYELTNSLDKQLDVLSKQFVKVIEKDEKIKAEYTGAYKILEDSRKQLINIYKLHSVNDGEEDFTKFKYYTGKVGDSEKLMEAYIAIVSAYAAYEDKITVLLPIMIGHLTSIVHEHSIANKIKFDVESEKIIKYVKEEING